MDNNRINIAVIEPSQIIYEGLSNILLKSKKKFFIYRFNDLEELGDSVSKLVFNIAIINPSAIQNKLADFIRLKNGSTNTLWIALIYSFFDNGILQKYDDTLTINASPEQIFLKMGQPNTVLNKSQYEELSEREIEVLTQLVSGLSNKEIADKLNISIHTVISHRKNITEKTGIKSLSGLTIYAITQKIIPLDNASV
jgi:DNA-binding CsgD family transcriptional regulator